MSNTRFEKLQDWIKSEYNNKSELVPLNNDASFRKYYRFELDNNLIESNKNKEILVAVDSPPDKEDNLAFLSIQQILEDNSVRVPKVIKYDKKKWLFYIRIFR